MARRLASEFAVGVDYGTNSVRALIVKLADGAEIASSVFNYPSGEHGILLDPKDPNLARQNPADYIQGLYRAVGGAVRKAKRTPASTSNGSSVSASPRPAPPRSRSTRTESPSP